MAASLSIALAAGFTSALMFASIVSGALIAIVLFYFAPLPLLVIALGWSANMAAIAALVASAGIALVGFDYVLIYLVTIALPAWWLGHKALLGRPADIGAPGAIEWYPPGRLLLWIVVLASAMSIAALLSLGTDSEDITSTIRRNVGRFIDLRMQIPDAGQRRMLTEFMTFVAPGITAGLAALTTALNLWLAGRIALMSGRLKRGWPDLGMTSLPPMTLVGFCVVLALSFLDGMLALFAQVCAGALLMAYALTGVATLQTLMRGRSFRLPVLISLCASALFFGWPILALIAVGLTDAFFGLRDRAGRSSSNPNDHKET